MAISKSNIKFGLIKKKCFNHRGMRRSKEESTHVRAIDLNRQAPIVNRKRATRYFHSSSCFGFTNSSNLSHVGPWCVLEDFRLSFHGQAFDDAWSFRSASLNTSRRKKGVKNEKNSAKINLKNWRFFHGERLRLKL